MAVHASMLSNGKVAAWDGFDAAVNSEQIWDPVTRRFSRCPSGANLFCAGHMTLPDGRLFVAGGHELAYDGLEEHDALQPADEHLVRRARTWPWAAGTRRPRRCRTAAC